MGKERSTMPIYVKGAACLFALWLSCALYQIVPGRTMLELQSTMCSFKQVWRGEHDKPCRDFLLNMSKTPGFKKVKAPPVLYYDINSNFTVEKLLKDTDDLKLPFVVTGFGSDGMEMYKDFDSVKENLVNEEYSFEVLKSDRTTAETHSNKTWKQPGFTHVTLPLHDALDRMKAKQDLYMRFNMFFADHNPILEKAMSKALKQTKADEFMQTDGLIQPPLGRVGRLCFLGYGTGYTTQHNAWMDNWFIQVAGSKQWRVVSPEYSPYMAQSVQRLTPASRSFLDNIPDDSPLPYMDFTTNPGDLFYFPALWWHEVYNVGGGVNLGCGYRPLVLTLKQAFSRFLFPPAASELPGFFANYAMMLPSIGRKLISIAFDPSGGAYWWKAKA